MNRPFILLVVATILAGCGGSESGEELLAAQADKQAQQRRRTLAAVPFVDQAVAAQRLMNFAEVTYPGTFPPGPPTQAVGGWWYRYYPGTGVYLAVINWRVFLLGGEFGPTVRDMGDLTQYVSFPSALQPITALRLATCPTASVVEAPNFYACTQGTLQGAQLFDKARPCSFKIEADGTTVMETDGRTFTITPATFGRALWTKTTGSSSYIDLSVYGASSVSPYVTFDIETQPTAGRDFFTFGGEVHVSVRQLFPEASMTCTFTVLRS